MTNYLRTVLLIFLLNLSLTAQTVPQKFFDALISGNGNIKEFINNNELAKSERLGIKYKDIDIKALLTYDIPTEIKQSIITGTYKYEIKEQTTGGNYTEAAFIVPDINYQKKYYFENGFVFNSTYLTRSWQTKQSKYFNFRLQEPKYFNNYCIQRLDDFVDMMADTLGFNEDEKILLEKEKIYYTFCSDEKEVEKITGFRSKGMALLANDEIVTAYQTHFHEVAHLLINYKLKTPGLYTLPFFMEGFAVAMGGRGGMAPRVVTDVGAYLQTTGFLTYDSILINEQFYNTDANMSYALSGLYNMFLFDELGFEKYIILYKKYNGNLDYIKSLNQIDSSIPDQKSFNNFISGYNKDLNFSLPDTIYPWNMQATENYVNISSANYPFSFSLSNDEVQADYISRVYEEIVKSPFNGKKYLLTVDKRSIMLYNCFNDELIASVDAGFSNIPIEIPYEKGNGKGFVISIKTGIFVK